MKKLVFIILLFTAFAYGQRPLVDATQYAQLTTAQRNALNINTDRTGFIWNNETGQFEYKIGAGAWQAFTGGGITWSTPVDADIIPDIDGSRDLGNTLTRFSALYADTGAITNFFTIGQGINFIGASSYITMFPHDVEPASSHGRLYADNSENRLKYYDGTSWKKVLLDGDAGASSPWTVIGDGVTDYTTAVNTAISTYGTVEIVNNVITTSVLSLPAGTLISGPGKITNNTTDVFSIAGNDVTIKDIEISTNAGNIFTFGASVFNFNLINTRPQQLSTTKSHFYLRGTTGVYGAYIRGNYFETGPNHTVPMIDVIVTQENFNGNTFSDNVYQTNGNPSAEVVRLETTAAANWIYGNRFINELFEIPTAGAIHAYSNNGLQIIGCQIYDVNFDTDSNDDYIVVDNTSGGLNSKGTLISGYQRVSSPLGTGFHDIDNRGHYAGGITIISPVGAPAGQLEFNNLSTHFLLGGSDISDNGGATVVGGGGGIGGSIATNQLAFGAATANEIQGSANAEFNGNTMSVNNPSNGAFNSVFTATASSMTTGNRAQLKFGHNTTFANDAADWRFQYNGGASLNNRVEFGIANNVNAAIAYDGNYDVWMDQGTVTAPIIDYDNTTSGLVATNVKAAIDEVEGRVDAAEMAITTNASDIADIETALNTTPSTELNLDIRTANYTLIAQDAEDPELLMLNYDDEEATINGGVFNEGAVIRIVKHPSATGETRVVEGTNVSFLGYTDGVILTTGSIVHAIRIGTATAPETWMIAGSSADIADYSGCTPDPNERNTTANASSDPNCNEANSTASWLSMTGSGTLSSTTTQVSVGTYSIEAEAGSGSSFARYNITGVTSGDTFDVTYSVYQSVGTTGTVTAWTNCTGGPTLDGIPNGSWETKTYSITASTTADIQLRFYAANSGNTGDIIHIDNLSIVKTN